MFNFLPTVIISPWECMSKVIFHTLNLNHTVLRVWSLICSPLLLVSHSFLIISTLPSFQRMSLESFLCQYFL
jgi:hypothetical protein